MADRPTRRTPRLNRARVVRTRRLSPGMVRVVLGGQSLAGFPAGAYTDHYVKLLFPAEGVRYPEPFDLADIRARLPRDQWPVTRTYTVRAWDAQACELTVDFVVHGDEGLAGPWAARAEPGEEVLFLGPGGGYRPSPEADWHLLVADESALPAVAASLEAVPGGAPVHAFVEVAGPEEEQDLALPPNAGLRWLHRGSGRVGARLVEAVRALDFPPGDVQAFVHGEAGWVRELRRHLRTERGVPRERLSVSGYWRLGHDEDGWQASKREWNARVEAEQEEAPGASASVAPVGAEAGAEDGARTR
ncbi:siderophore-interacting protein [Streptomyces pini]|uniref:NADPH-dependent ferric siderophore reductase, contains FAD-binding and SIP domains n=1 Tax=Streptomyces pini TaxID=1520580 RepID=A0A1I4F7S3_9ACTN|nr:siderophore-interacting protein [Streptomyces pini]SFL13340.1 NADPH-dependent ferric siderophore reductase, contains FAD-binding and SIP domains [Streptomyces pini]